MKRFLTNSSPSPLSSPCTSDSGSETASESSDSPVRTPQIKKSRYHSPLLYHRLNNIRSRGRYLKLSDRIRRKMIPLPLSEDERYLDSDTLVEMSPLSQLANTFNGAYIGTPTSSRHDAVKGRQFIYFLK